ATNRAGQSQNSRGVQWRRGGGNGRSVAVSGSIIGLCLVWRYGRRKCPVPCPLWRCGSVRQIALHVSKAASGFASTRAPFVSRHERHGDLQGRIVSRVSVV